MLATGYGKDRGETIVGLMSKLFKGLFALAIVFVGCFVILQVVMYWLLADLVPFPTFSFRAKEWIMGSLENYIEDPEMITIIYNGEVYSGPGDVPTSMPVSGSIFCDYGKNVTCANGYVYANHTGIDIPVESGTSVHTTIAGTVVYAGPNSDGYGNLVVVQNGKVQTFYAHNSSVDVTVGQFVKPGQVVAESGSTGNSTGPHVHYEVRVNGQPVDPRSLSSSEGK
jgi:murein DD-endopeptidase MepM/ murein hydrolase activator NlpD